MDSSVPMHHGGNALTSHISPQIQQHRPVRYMFTPTRLYFGSRLPCDSVSHQAVVVGDPNSPDGVLTSELRPFGANQVEHETHYAVMLAPSQVKRLNRAAVLGYTQMTDREILREGEPVSLLIRFFHIIHTPACALIQDHGTYNFIRCNCQDFAYALAKSILREAVIEPDCDARYCFTREILALVNQPFTGISEGWIVPTTTAILVNVKTTDKPDTWFGEVEGSEEKGLLQRMYYHVRCI